MDTSTPEMLEQFRFTIKILLNISADPIYIEAMTNARQENFYRALSNSLEHFKRVPHNVYSDNMKQYVTRSSRYEPTFSYMAEEWSVHYNTALHATRVRKPKDKASVESHVNIVYMKIYARNAE